MDMEELIKSGAVAFSYDDEVKINGYSGNIDFIGADVVDIKVKGLPKDMRFKHSEIKTFEVIEPFNAGEALGFDNKEWDVRYFPFFITISKDGAKVC
jgi:hypothetical protein